MKNTLSEKPVLKKIFLKRFAVIMTSAVVLCIAAYALASYFFKSYVKEKADKRALTIANYIDTIAEQYKDAETGQMNEEQYQRFIANVDGKLLWCNSFPEVKVGDSYPRQAIRVFSGDNLIADSTEKPSFDFSDRGAYTCHPEVAERFVKDNAEFKEEYAGKDRGVGFRIERMYISGRYCAPCISYIVTEYDSKTGTETDRVIKTVEYYPENTAGMELIEREECGEKIMCHIPESNELDRCEKVMNTVTERLLKGKEAYASNANTGETVTVRDIDYDYLDEIAGTESWQGKDGVCFGESRTASLFGEKIQSDLRVVLGIENSLMHYYPRAVIISALGILLVAFLIAYSSSKISYADRKAQYEIYTARQETTRAMAHDLKTPMTSISGYAEMLQGNVKPEKQEHYLEMIKQNVEQMNTIVGDILELSKAESDSGVLVPEQIVIADLCREIADSMSGAFSKAELTCKINAVTSSVISADRKLLVQAVTNLFHNAAVYSKQGTEITVTVSGSELSIKNIPEVMPNKPASELVKPFVKGNDFRGGNTGSGVGLSIVKHNLERMGFKFEIQLGADTFTAKCLFN